MTTSASLCEGPIFYFYARVSSIPSHFNPNYSLVGKHHVVGKDPSIYGHSNIFDNELLLLTIIYKINKFFLNYILQGKSLTALYYKIQRVQKKSQLEGGKYVHRKELN